MSADGPEVPLMGGMGLLGSCWSAPGSGGFRLAAILSKAAGEEAAGEMDNGRRTHGFIFSHLE